ncbi:MAG: FHA domain-containing protein [Gemmataceae bacterium]|nr:FHA domain-containing protein [Gemmataceae bacterium]MCI0743147.1 FHA domain-containing protein [Gemmataceae bacterium]
MQFYLIAATSSKRGMPIPIGADRFVIGSGKKCQLRSKSLARKHCALLRREDRIFVHDEGSGAPTLVNDVVMPSGEEWPLHAGDHVACGKLAFVIQALDKPLPQAQLEEWATRCLDQGKPASVWDEAPEPEAGPRTASQAAQGLINKMAAQRGVLLHRLHIGREGGVIIVRFNDEMLVDDGDIALVRRELHDHLDKPNLRVLLDFQKVQRMSTGAVAMLREFANWLGKYDSTLALCGVGKDIRKILATMHVEHLPIFPDKKPALLEQW